MFSDVSIRKKNVCLSVFSVHIYVWGCSFQLAFNTVILHLIRSFHLVWISPQVLIQCRSVKFWQPLAGWNTYWKWHHCHIAASRNIMQELLLCTSSLSCGVAGTRPVSRSWSFWSVWTMLTMTTSFIVFVSIAISTTRTTSALFSSRSGITIVIHT